MSKELKLEDLKCVDGFYYVGDILEYSIDGNPWVEKSVVVQLIKDVNERRQHIELMFKESYVVKEHLRPAIK
jgi:hypothetical protein